MVGFVLFVYDHFHVQILTQRPLRHPHIIPHADLLRPHTLKFPKKGPHSHRLPNIRPVRLCQLLLVVKLIIGVLGRQDTLHQVGDEEFAAILSTCLLIGVLAVLVYFVVHWADFGEFYGVLVHG